MNIVQVLKIFHASRIVSVQKVEEGAHGGLGCDTCFNSTQFAVYNGVNHNYKNAAVMEQLDLQ